jgi:hypothetical protein
MSPIRPYLGRQRQASLEETRDPYTLIPADRDALTTLARNLRALAGRGLDPVHHHLTAGATHITGWQGPAATAAEHRITLYTRTTTALTTIAHHSADLIDAYTTHLDATRTQAFRAANEYAYGSQLINAGQYPAGISWHNGAATRLEMARAGHRAAASTLAAALDHITDALPTAPSLLDHPSWHLDLIGRNTIDGLAGLGKLTAWIARTDTALTQLYNPFSSDKTRDRARRTLTDARTDLQQLTDDPEKLARGILDISTAELSPAAAAVGLVDMLGGRAKSLDGLAGSSRQRWVPPAGDPRFRSPAPDSPWYNPDGPPMFSTSQWGHHSVAQAIGDHFGGRNGMLWITGQSGAGKGTLTSSLRHEMPGRIVQFEQDWLQNSKAIRDDRVLDNRTKPANVGSSSYLAEPSEWAGSATGIWDHRTVQEKLRQIRTVLDSGQGGTVVIKDAWHREKNALGQNVYDEVLNIKPDSIVVFDAKYDLYGLPHGARFDDLRIEVTNTDSMIRKNYVGRTMENYPPAQHQEKFDNYDHVYKPSYERFRRIQDEAQAKYGRPPLIDLIVNNDPDYLP